MLARAPAKAAAELELKFQLGAGAVEALEADLFPPEKASVSHLHAIYYDTPEHALRDAGFGLRVRRRGDTHVQTLKHRGAGGLFERSEWEAPVPGLDLDMTALDATPARAVVGDEALIPAFVVEVERRTHIWTHGRSRVEVSFDTGVIVAGGRTDAIAELELELISGSRATLFALARQLQAKAVLTLSFASKAERGYRLAGHDGVAALKAQQSAIGPDVTTGAAFQAIARDALVQVAGNVHLLRRAHNPDVLHQARVGLRRLRAALAVFKPMLDPDGLAYARTETKWLAGEMALARDLDVFLQRRPPGDEIDDSPARAAFLRALRIAQADAYERALKAVDSDRFRSLLLGVAEWIEAGAWRRIASGERRALRERPVSGLAASVLQRLDRRVRKRSRKFARLDAGARHELRKQVKKLRYASAFFGEVFSEHPKRRERFVGALRLVQDRLGDLNDLAVARTVARRALGKRTGEIAFAAGEEVGRITAGEDELLAAAAEAFKAFRRTRTFWSEPKAHAKDLNLSQPRLRSV
ncbi:CYTH and CHAD domain-containing protein [Phenylobacterium sp.]|uniref:CYTH and CHAD domain-containing protein n=1 Tax=Phenylobacterium sp. TaxID=1871053 RepID=UPI0025FCED12|nr:CYTH and CHAD domain-containing protein [Phenylobacterium sp.]